ncbi:MAG: hypothetical protein KGL46_07495 [Hyphomicrobiales bacterium]|nr:hypothetical protein [Hyphomicrobiales bacterium]
MEFVQLIFTVCSLANPSVCEEQHLEFSSHGSLRHCMAEAPPQLAQWIEQHPGKVIRKFHCAWPGAEGQKI